MPSLEELQKKYSDLSNSLFAEGILDEQFTQLQQLQDESNPDFVAEVLDLFFDDSDKLIDKLTEELESDPIDFKKVDAHVHQFKGSSSNVGAQRVKATCIDFRGFCEESDKKGCIQALSQLKEQYNEVKEKLQQLLELEGEIISLGGQPPYLEE